MKQRRRLEITAFRRRTTIVLRDREEHVLSEQLAPREPASPSAPTDRSQAGGDDLNSASLPASATDLEIAERQK